jgi:pimeloyl-ACP methyl ester carboxylesterase
MSWKVFDRFWHQTLRRPYRLAKTVDEGQGAPVILLHGIGRTGQVWEHVVALLVPLGARVVAFDLLGFGASPKPEWPLYDVDDHAQAVIASIAKLRLSEPAVLVGHSMGCLVAVRVASLRPELVKRLVLYEMPLYEGLPEKRRYRLRIDLYLKLYRRLTRYQPSFNDRNIRLSDRLARKVAGFEVTAQTWQPFIKSLEHTIIEQTTAEDIKRLDTAMDVIYGSFDMFVIRGKAQQFFGADTDNIAVHNIRARHVISPKASRFIVERVMAAFNEVESNQLQSANQDVLG